MATMCKNQKTRLKEWILYHNSIGVDKFIIFLDDCNDGSLEKLEYIRKKYNLNIIIYLTEVLNKESLKLHWINRSHLMYDYVINNYYNETWIIFIEVDEFIFIFDKNINLTNFLKNVDTKCVYINSWDFKPPFDETKNILGQSFYCWTDSERFNNGYMWRGKSIIRPNEFSKCIDAHHFMMKNGNVSNEFKMNRDKLQIYHGKEVYIDDNKFRIGHFRNHTPYTLNNNYVNMEHMIKKKVCIVGSGWYGCYIAEYLITKYNYLDITIIDKNNDIFEGSSSKNQNRLHLGFHYPQSKITREKCQKYFSEFIKKYSFLLEDINKNFYAISNVSNIDFDNYIKLYENYSIVKNDFLNNIEKDILNVDEKYINFAKSKEYFKNKLQTKIKFIFNYEVKKIENIDNRVSINEELIFDKVFNCTYNQIQTTQNVIYEKCISLIYKKINDVPFESLTLVNGNLWSLYKYKDDLFTLTNVKYTPLFKGKFEEINNCNYDLENKIYLFEKDVLMYYPDFNVNFLYIDYFESYKCKNICDDDSRDININIDYNIFNVWCGKISFIFELKNKIKLFI